MPRNGSGTYSQPANTAAVANQTASSTNFNTLISDIGNEITASLPVAGTKAMTAALPMGSNKITGLADGTATTDAMTVGQAAMTNAKTITVDDSSQSSVTNILTLLHTSTTTPAAGIGSGLVFATETTTGNTESGVILEAVTTDVTGASEDFDLVIKTMAGGAAATEAARIKSTGLTQLKTASISTSGTHTSVSAGSATAAEQNAVDSNVNWNYMAYASGGNAFGGSVIAVKSRNATIGSHTVVNSGDVVFDQVAYASDGAAYQPLARHTMSVDGTPGSGDMPGRQAWYTTKDGTITSTLRMLMDSGHNVYLYKDDGANPGQITAEHWIKLSADYTLANSGAAQKLFDASTNGTITLDTGQYFFESLLYLTTMSATSGNMAFTLGGTATFARILFIAQGIDSTTPLAANTTTMSGSVTAGSATSIVTAATGTGMLVWIKGTFDVTVAGTLIPQGTLVTAIGTVLVKAGSYFRCWRAGDTAAVSVGAWS